MVDTKYEYKYKCPTEYGMKKVKVTRKQHNEMFNKRKLKWGQRAEYYIDLEKDRGEIHFFANNLGIIVTILLFPMLVLINGIGNIKELIDEYSEFFNKKEKGAFTKDSFSPSRYDIFKYL